MPQSHEPGRRILDRHNYVPHYLMVLANGMAWGQSRIYLKHFGIGINECRLITVAAHSPGLTAKDASDILAMNKSIVSRGVQTLEAKGLVEPQGGRRRSRGLYLTHEGSQLHDQIVEVSLEREKRLLAGFAPNEKTIVLGYLARMFANLQEANDYDPLEK